MKLPLDNFQVLGVSPTANTRNILIMLERKLERCEYSGFTKETLYKRNELLKEYAKPLLDNEKRKELEELFANKNIANEDACVISVASGYEAAGLLLLLEAKQYEECITLSVDYLDKQLQTGSNSYHQNIDLYRTIAYSTLEYAKELKSGRYYELSTRVLEYGLNLVKDVTELTPILEVIRSELNDMTPYRILDLLSRDTDDPIREKGIKMLNRFVKDRGGLDSPSSLYIEDNEFKIFFRQIRFFLTLQEQLDLYEHWCKEGSESACFLFALALVACGFARRKPERLIQSLLVLKSLECEELNQMITYIHLLLGNVDISAISPIHTPDDKCDTTSATNEVSLANLCSHCREWLERDVLDGYRDVEIDSDLEAYFSDRDVTRFIESNDLTSRGNTSSSHGLSDSLETNSRLFNRLPNAKIFDWNSSNTKQPSAAFSATIKKLQHFIFRLSKPKWYIIFASAAPFIIILAFMGNSNDQRSTEKLQSRFVQSNKDNTMSRIELDINKEKNQSDGIKLQPQLQQNPSESELEIIISQWLSIKTNTLSGSSIPSSINSIATSDAIQRLKSERYEDQMRGELQKISAKLISLKVLRRQSNIIEVEAILSYSDKRLNQENSIVDSTPQKTFKKRYTLVKIDSSWKLQ